jgi:radical SAM superfamily enzyme YgiQ (UPF0313 family)
MFFIEPLIINYAETLKKIKYQILIMKTLFLVPPTSKAYGKDILARHTCPHIGLAYVVAYVRSRGIEVEVLDANAERLNFDDLEFRIRKIKPDVVGITANTLQIKDAHKSAGVVKKIDKNIKTIIGGYHVTAIPKETLIEFENFDFGVYGEGEITAYELIRAIMGDSKFDDVKGIVWRKDDKVIVNDSRPQIEDLDSLPFPAYELFPLGKYNSYFLDNKKRLNYLNPFINQKIVEVPLTTSRGCPYQCVFCARPMGNNVRKRSPENVVKEISHLVENLKVNRIIFCDETLTLDTERGSKICDQIIENGFHKKVEWLCETRVDCVTKDLLKKMHEAGCVYLGYGIDSGNDEILKAIKKNSTVQQARDAVRWTKEAGIKVFASCIIGHMEDTKETIRQTIDLAFEIDPEFVAFSMLTPFPGTEVHKIASKEMGINSNDWDKYGKQMGDALIPKNLTRKELERIQFKAYSRFYLRPRKILNLLDAANMNALPSYLSYNLNNFIRGSNGKR